MPCLYYYYFARYRPAGATLPAWRDECRRSDEARQRGIQVRPTSEPGQLKATTASRSSCPLPPLTYLEVTSVSAVSCPDIDIISQAENMPALLCVRRRSSSSSSSLRPRNSPPPGLPARWSAGASWNQTGVRAPHAVLVRHEAVLHDDTLHAHTHKSPWWGGGGFFSSSFFFSFFPFLFPIPTPPQRAEPWNHMPRHFPRDEACSGRIHILALERRGGPM